MAAPTTAVPTPMMYYHLKLFVWFYSTNHFYILLISLINLTVHVPISTLTLYRLFYGQGTHNGS